jgi:hypothetical protein
LAALLPKKRKKEFKREKTKGDTKYHPRGARERERETETDRDRAPLTTLLFRVGILRERERESDGENLS